MTAGELAAKLGAEILAGEEGLSRSVEGCYIGDLLSWVMSRAEGGDAWITVMGNVNGVAVAKLADLSCILLSENAHLDDDAKEQANLNKIPVLRSQRNAYRLALEIGGLLR